MCNKMYTFPTILFVASMLSCVKSRHRFIFVREMWPYSTFHNCKDGYKGCPRNHFVFYDILKLDHGKIALFTLHTHLRLLYNKDIENRNQELSRANSQGLSRI